MPRQLRLTWIFLTALLLAPRFSAAAPLGNPEAPKGGSITIGVPGYPKALPFYLAFEEIALAMNNLVLETLVEAHPDTYELIPLLAKEWTVSKDNKVFTFKLNPEARFADGKPVTAEDVKFTWDTLFNPKHKTAPFQSYFTSLGTCEIVDTHTVKFTAKDLHFKNVEKFTTLMILPKHVFSKGDFNKAFNHQLAGSGPYTLESARAGERVTFKRNPKYWGARLPQNLGRFNFDKVTFRVVPDHNVSFELFKKGELDYFYFLISKMWATETDSAPFQKNYILKIRAENKLPYATEGIAWNLRRPLFQDKRVRLALSHLMNREKINKELFYGNYAPSTGIVNRASDYHDPALAPMTFDPKKAKALLDEAGWKAGPDGVLAKDGKRFEFELVTENPAYLRWLTVYQEDLKKMGIRMSVRVTDWATRAKIMDDWQFDATDVAREREVHPSDFGVMWGSEAADKKGSGNFTGYKNPEVDALAKQIDQSFDEKERIRLVRKLEAIIAADAPIAFSKESTFFRLGHWNRFSYPGKGYFSYSTWRDAFQYWWHDDAKDAKLRKAKLAGEPLS